MRIIFMYRWSNRPVADEFLHLIPDLALMFSPITVIPIFAEGDTGDKVAMQTLKNERRSELIVDETLSTFPLEKVIFKKGMTIDDIRLAIGKKIKT